MDAKETRRLNLIRFRDEECGGSTAELARKIDKSPSYASRMLYTIDKAQARRISEDMAREIEGTLHKPAGWLDRPVDGTQLKKRARPRAPEQLSVEDEIQLLVTRMSRRERIQLLGAAKLIMSLKGPDQDIGSSSNAG